MKPLDQFKHEVQLQILTTKLALINTEVEGMKAENLIREDQGRSLAYDDSLFIEKAVEINGVLLDLKLLLEDVNNHAPR